MVAEETVEPRPSRHLFSLEDMDSLLQTICATEQIPDPPKYLPVQDKVYRGLVNPHFSTFPCIRQSRKLFCI